MKLLLDTCMWGGAVADLRAAGHDVIWAGDWAEDPGDEEILAHAHREDRILVTLDKDFGELAIVFGLPHAGIIRLVGQSATQQAAVCVRVLAFHTELARAAAFDQIAADSYFATSEISTRNLQAGAIVTVEPGRLRIRPA